MSDKRKPKRVYRLEKDANKLLLVLPERVEWGNVQGLVRALDRALRDGHRFVVMDFTATGYIDSVSIGNIVKGQKQFLAAGGSLILYNAPPAIRKLFKLTMLADQFPIFDGIEAAESYIRERTAAG